MRGVHSYLMLDPIWNLSHFILSSISLSPLFPAHQLSVSSGTCQRYTTSRFSFLPLGVVCELNLSPVAVFP